MTLVYVNQTVVPSGTVAVETLDAAIENGNTNLKLERSTITSSRFKTRLTIFELNPVAPVILIKTYLLQAEEDGNVFFQSWQTPCSVFIPLKRWTHFIKYTYK